MFLLLVSDVVVGVITGWWLSVHHNENHSVQHPYYDCAGTSLESFLYGQSNILERYPDSSAECYEEECVRPEGFVEEQERISALYAEIRERLGDDFESEEFYRLMMVGENPADCSKDYGEYEMFVSCVVGTYRERKEAEWIEGVFP